MIQTIRIVNESLLTNLPDKAFFDYCHECYGVNRGVYNVIDQWLYQSGNQAIEARRDAILHFLDYLQQQEIKKFGKGGVKSYLEGFMSNQMGKEVG
ncbi:hypothetical protein [Niallia oryzisoli]|uniref:hypothetical protein n=1 Tax=Niallia oryzisoli TaxID=1737571 RepID=UPI0037362042